ncbi:MAG: hypothetical protein WA584_23545 [Pyrinomonadaceae bacterium]
MSKQRTPREQRYIDDRIKELHGAVKRRQMFRDGVRRDTLEDIVEKYGACEKMCHNCAFRPGSVEEIAARESLDSQLWRVLSLLDEAVEGTGPFEPFFCHQDMPTNDGGHNFQPDLSDEGLPEGFPICAGWRAAVIQAKRFQANLELSEPCGDSASTVEQSGDTRYADAI